MARSKSKNVGLIGLGIIGSRVAAALRKRGLQVFVWNRTPRLEQYFVGSPVEVAELCDVVQLFVADDTALLETVRQLTPGLTAQHVVTAHCTVAPESMRAAAEIVERRGARFLEAPFTGSKVAAENGQLVYYIGGDEAALKKARPVLEASSKEIIVIGEIGDASVMKVATNIVTAATAQVAAEALALLGKAGIAPELFTRAMKSNASNSPTLEMKVPLMLAGDFEPHFSVKHMLKDVRIAAKLAREFSLDLPVTEVSSDMLLAELKQGRGDADYSSVAQKYFSGPQKIVRPEPRKIEEPPKPAEPVFRMGEARPIVTEAIAETKPAEPAVSELPPVTVEPVAEIGPPEPEPARYEVPPMATEPVPETKPPEPEPTIYAAPPIPAQSVDEIGRRSQSPRGTRFHRWQPNLFPKPSRPNQSPRSTRLRPYQLNLSPRSGRRNQSPRGTRFHRWQPNLFPKPSHPNQSLRPTRLRQYQLNLSTRSGCRSQSPRSTRLRRHQLNLSPKVDRPSQSPRDTRLRPYRPSPVAKIKPPAPEPAIHQAPPIAAKFVIETKPTESRPQQQEPAPISAKPPPETTSDQPLPKRRNLYRSQPNQSSRRNLPDQTGSTTRRTRMRKSRQALIFPAESAAGSAGVSRGAGSDATV